MIDMVDELDMVVVLGVVVLDILDALVTDIISLPPINVDDDPVPPDVIGRIDVTW